MKAQLTIEFLLILVVVLLLFSGISLDLMNTAVSDAMEIQAAEIIHVADSKLSNAGYNVFIQGKGASKLVELQAPVDCSYVIASSSATVQCPEKSKLSEKFNGKQLGKGLENITYSPITIGPGERGEVQIQHA